MTELASPKKESSHSVASNGWTSTCCTVECLRGVRVSVLDGAVAWTPVVGLNVPVVSQRRGVQVVDHHRLVWHRCRCVRAGVGWTGWLRWRIARRWRVVWR